MVSWGFSLVLAVSFLGPLGRAVPQPPANLNHHKLSQHHQQPHPPQPIQDPEPATTPTTMANVSPIQGQAAATNAGNDGGPSSSTTNQGNSVSISTTSTTPTTSATPTSTTSASATATFEYFPSLWLVSETYDMNGNELLDLWWAIPSPIPQSGGPSAPYSPALMLLQTDSSRDLGNVWTVAQLNNCSAGSCSVNVNATIHNPVKLEGLSPNGQYFFCLANQPRYIDQVVCNSYGPFFQNQGVEVGQSFKHRELSPRQESPTSPTATLTPAGNVLSTLTSITTITNFSPTVTVSGVPQTLAVSGASSVAGSTTSFFSTATVTTPTSTWTGPAATSAIGTVVLGHSGGLSTGAKVGIAIGALAFAAILALVVLFFLRRKRRQRSPPPEQVMLTRDMHTDSFGRAALIAEKETLAQSHIANASPVDEALPIQRHSAHSPYDSIPTAPYTGATAGVPRRKPTNASAVSRISGPASPRSLTVSTPPDEYEEYRDTPMPVYGDARHSPRVYSTEERQGVQAPFLTEEGMSAEEMARLEEEERRIDAAIAEAERSGRR